MKLTNNFWNRITGKSKSLYLYGVKKQAKNKPESLAGSIVDKRTATWKPFMLLLPTFIILGAFTILPLFYNIYYAFVNRITAPDGSYYETFTLEHMKSLFESDPIFAVGIRNSLMYGLIVLPFVMGISLIISSAIATTVRARAKGFWQTIFFLPYITNIVAISLAFQQIFAKNGMFNAMFGSDVAWLESGDAFSLRPMLVMVTQGIWSGLAFNILIFTTAMLSVDKNLYRSASIDGIGGVKQFFNITLPSIKSTTNFLVTMGIIGGIKVFPLALFHNNASHAWTNGASTLMLYVYGKTGAGELQAAAASAISLFIIGITFSTIVRGGFKAIMRASNHLGEYNVWMKIKKSSTLSKN